MLFTVYVSMADGKSHGQMQQNISAKISQKSNQNMKHYHGKEEVFFLNQYLPMTANDIQK